MTGASQEAAALPLHKKAPSQNAEPWQAIEKQWGAGKAAQQKLDALANSNSLQMQQLQERL